MDRPAHFGVDGAQVIDGLSQNVDKPAQCFCPHGDLDAVAGVDHDRATGQSVGRCEGHCADAVVAHMLLYFRHDVERLDIARFFLFYPDRVIDTGESSGREFRVNNDAHDLHDPSFGGCGRVHVDFLFTFGRYHSIVLFMIKSFKVIACVFSGAIRRRLPLPEVPW